MRARVLPALAATLPLALGGCAAQRQVLLGRPSVPPVAADAPAPSAVPPAMAWLYGSGEAAALSEQAYNGMVRYVRDVLDRARDRRGRLPSQRRAGTLPRWPASAVLMPGATAASAETVPCGTLPPAVVLDMDETAVLNLGYEYDDAQAPHAWDQQRWERWERAGATKVGAVPGAVAAFRALRAMGVTMIVNTNRSAANADQTAQALANAGLGDFRHGETLFLKGDVDGKSGKDGRRAAIAARYCVLALAGDQLGDFADLFNPPGPAPAVGRRMLTAVGPIEARWGNGWFVLPNPVYGTGLGAGWDETFPADKRWKDAP
ncbi:5'-nucleotidase (lipoprotein e(P4) family) [Sphingomonas sp. BE138]|uniref:5'-nucleotidase, lipoprotein e(P4) family n=1 Tax=Sphingomonas sp. BE138 TaxID=2817845 RepID=UPI00285A7399|nr:HAD family acid phosphatase [Sphingomonas sp. BE138]MDR6788676.1 5'-nucleotidase (lipoprotein e(P4) family) [Sphingomonas sp. BE138]